MSTEGPVLDAMLNDHLVRLLTRHGIQAHRRDDRVQVGADESRWTRLTATRESSSSAARLHLDAAGPDGSIMMDSLNGLGNDPMPAPEADFTKALVDAAPRLFNERRARAGRVFVAVLNGELTYEAMLDMQPSDPLEEVLRSVPIAPPASGYASQRLFFLALPQQGGTAHVRVGRCTTGRAPELAPSQRSRLWVGLAFATALIAVVYLAMR